MIFMAATTTNTAKAVAKKAASDPKVAKTVAKTASKETVRNLARGINGTNVALIGLGVAGVFATRKLRELYLITKAKADNPGSPLEARESRA